MNFEVLDQRFDRLVKALIALNPHLGHTAACSYGDPNPSGDFCTCDLAGRKRDARIALESVASLLQLPRVGLA